MLMQLHFSGTAIPVIIEGHETAFNGFKYQFTSGKPLKDLKPTLNYYGNGSNCTYALNDCFVWCSRDQESCCYVVLWDQDLCVVNFFSNCFCGVCLDMNVVLHNMAMHHV
jgi:hypothetical protein